MRLAAAAHDHMVSRSQSAARLAGLAAEGRSLAISGPAGVGKTFLMRQVLTLADPQPVAVILAATESLQTIPLGAFLPLMSDPASRAEAGSIEATAAKIRTKLVGSGLSLIAVDDIHFLDSASARLLRDVVQVGVTIVCTVREGELLSDAVRALWDAAAILSEAVPALSSHEVAAIAVEQLGQAVDRRLTELLLERSSGNPLLLIHLIASSVSSARIVNDSGVWVAADTLPVVPEIAELLALDIGGLDPAHRRLLELVALAEPLPLALARTLVSPVAIESAEALKVVAIDSIASGHIRTGSPIWRDAALAALPRSRRWRLLGELVDGVVWIDPVSRVRSAAWRIERGEAIGAGELEDLIRLVEPSAPAMLETFLRAAILGDGGADAQLKLADLLLRQNRTEEALDQLLAVDDTATEPTHLRKALALRVQILALQTNRPDQALALLDKHASVLSAEPAEAGRLRATALWRLGRVVESAELATAVLADTAAPANEAIDAGFVAGYAMVYGGDRQGFSLVRSRLNSLLADQHRDGGSTQLALLDSAAALMNGHDVDEYRVISTTGHDAALRHGDDVARAEFAAELGWAEVLAGDLRSGLVLLREAYAVRAVRTLSGEQWVRSLLISALVLAGEQDEAESIWGEFSAEVSLAPIYDSDAGIAQAALLAGRGQLAEAAKRARDTAAAARVRGQGYLARVCWYLGMRYGDISCSHELLRQMGTPETPADHAIAAHASAIANLDPEGTERAAELLLKAGFRWFAAEAQAQAASLYRRQRASERAGLAAERLGTILLGSREFSSPVVALLYRPVLTTRESELTRLASLGHSDRVISEQLGISVRTVTTHLSRAYRKLGVGGRAELADRLRVDLN
ncbi:LuxR C-terminal-related transcriptional regulator [soil metagenome]